MADSCSAEQSNSAMEYVMTPETPFTPMGEFRKKKNATYVIGSVMKVTESRNMEYKLGRGKYSTMILPEHVRKYGSAFLNSGGGTLCIGVEDDGTVRGVMLPCCSSRDKIRDTVVEEFKRFTPPVDRSGFTIDFVPCSRYGCFVVEIHVRAGDPRKVYSDGDNNMFVRRDGSVHGPLWPREIREIVAKKFFQSLAEDKENLQASR